MIRKKVYLVLIVGLFVATISLAVMHSGKGVALVAVLDESRRLEEENKLLQDQLLVKSSVSQVSASAESLGLVRPTRVLYLNNLSKVASKQ